MEPDIWHRLLQRGPARAGCSALYDPLVAHAEERDGRFVLGRITQTLDGRIATSSGASQWISGRGDVVHTHRLRALFDAVIVGAGTVQADNPQLTTREVVGPSPVRVVLDTERRLDDHYRVFRDGPETLLLCADDAAGADRLGIAGIVRVPRAAKGLRVSGILAALAERGLRRLFVEGGGITVSRFLAAGALDRLHVTIAPLLLGSGIPAFTLPHATALSEGLRFDWTVHHLGDDLLLDIPLHRARPDCARD